MPTGHARTAVARILSVAALALALVVAGVVLLRGGGEEYRVRVLLQNASQLVRGNLVKVGGQEVGKVTDIRLTDDNQAELLVDVSDEELAPLHEGTSATVRATSLSGVANRYLALAPGPNNRPEIPDGGVVPADRTRSSVDLDAILNTLDAEARAGLQDVIHHGARLVGGREREANAALEALNPALAQTAATTRELMRDQPALERFLVETAAVVSAVASRDEDLEAGLRGGARATAAIARERAALGETIERAPAVLRRANTTLVDLRATLRELQPALREGRPVAPRLSRVLVAARPVLRRGRPAIANLRRLVPELNVVLRRLPGLERSARPAIESAARALREALPIVTGLRPYVPDVVAGLLNGFGGTTSGYYDANGHYVRISFQGSPYSLNNSGSLVPVPPSEGSLSGYRRFVVARCPGGAQEPGPDGSNPWLTPEAQCDPDGVP